MNRLEKVRNVKKDVEDELLEIPGVTGVDIGYKYINNQKTETLAIRVYVEEKKPRTDIPEKELIPKEINGVPIDVIERKFVLHTNEQEFSIFEKQDKKKEKRNENPFRNQTC